MDKHGGGPASGQTPTRRPTTAQAESSRLDGIMEGRNPAHQPLVLFFVQDTTRPLCSGGDPSCLSVCRPDPSRNPGWSIRCPTASLTDCNLGSDPPPALIRAAAELREHGQVCGELIGRRSKDWDRHSGWVMTRLSTAFFMPWTWRRDGCHTISIDHCISPLLRVSLFDGNCCDRHRSHRRVY